MRTRLWLRYLALLLWMGLIYLASDTPDLRALPLLERFLPVPLEPEEAALAELLLRKGAHMLTFGILALLARWALAGSFPRLSPARLNLAAFLVALLYAASDEYHQHFVPTRQGSALDVLIDAAGAWIALRVCQSRPKG